MMGVFADKDYNKILEIMSPYSDTLIAFGPGNPRGLPSALLAGAAEKMYSNVIDGQNIQKAFECAQKSVQDDDIIISFGSLSTIGDLYAIMETRGINND